MGKNVAIIGGGAAGFFLAVCLKETAQDVDVTIFESGRRVLRKVKVSGGGRCNVTNTFASVGNLAEVYPRGHRLMKRLFKRFSPADAFRWWEEHGVRLVVQADDCVFPKSQQSQEIIDCLVGHAHRYGVKIKTEHRIGSLAELADYDAVCIATGGMNSGIAALLSNVGIDGHGVSIPIIKPLPSLFSFSIDDAGLQALQGTVADVTVRLSGTNFAASGAMLLTHWGVSGPATLRLSSYAARHLAENGYKATLLVNWLNASEEETRDAVARLEADNAKRLIPNAWPPQFSQRLWAFLVNRALGESATKRWSELSKKDRNRLTETLCNSLFHIAGRAPFNDEFVTCGGVSLQAVNPNTLEWRGNHAGFPRIYFAGEVLDIDGVTGGFNFQAAWTSAYIVAQAIAGLSR